MSFTSFHGIKLAANGVFTNFNIERLASDPVPVNAGRAWYNTTDKVWRFSTLDGTGAVIVRTFADAEAMAAAISALQASLTTAINNEASRAQTAETTLQSNITAEASARSAAIATEVNDRNTAIAAEATAREAADAQLQTALNAAMSNLQWRPGAKAATSDADLNAASNGTTLTSLLPFSDDDAPLMVIGDFAAGDFLISKNGASSKVFKIIDDAGTLKVTTVGVDPLVAGHTFIVANDLPDIASREGMAIYSYTGSDVIKVGDFDWSLATGIDLSSSFAPTAGAIVAGDSIEAAISKLVANLAAEATARTTAITNESNRAQAAEATLQSAITTLSGQVGGSTGNLADLTTTNKSTLVAAINEAVADVATEAAARAAADTAEASARATAVTNEANTRAAAITTVTNAVTAEVSRAEAAEATLSTAVSDEATARAAADAALKALINAQKFTYTSTTEALVHTVSHNLNSDVLYSLYIKNDSGVWVNDVAPIEVTNANTLTVTLSTAGNVKVVVQSGAALT